jgi:signal transduction histidine kinase
MRMFQSKDQYKLKIQIFRTIFSDENRFRQILLNLLSNALKFTFKGFIGIDISFVENCIECEVKDTGIGIKEKDSDKLFKTFGMIEESSNMNKTGKYKIDLF